MNKDNLSFADVEQLLTELAQHDLRAAARDDAQTELMRSAARREIHRVFFRRRCRRVAGSIALLAGLGGAVQLLLPEQVAQAPLPAASLPMREKLAPSLARAAQAKKSTVPAPAPSVPYHEPFECSTEACEVVIYSVPL